MLNVWKRPTAGGRKSNYEAAAFEIAFAACWLVGASGRTLGLKKKTQMSINYPADQGFSGLLYDIGVRISANVLTAH